MVAPHREEDEHCLEGEFPETYYFHDDAGQDEQKSEELQSFVWHGSIKLGSVEVKVIQKG